MSVAALFAAIAGGCAASVVLLVAAEVVAGGRARRRSVARAQRLRRLLSRVGPGIGRSPLARFARDRDLGARIVAAGEPGELTPRDWLTIKSGAAGCAFVCSVPIAGDAPGRLGIAIVLGAPVAAFFAPDFWLGRAVRTRLEGAVAELPDLLDLMRVTVEAGATPPAALASVGARFEGPLAAECRRAASSIALGRPASDALAELGRRLPDPQVRRFVETMRSAGRHGVGLSEALRALASAARHAAHQRLRERAAKAGPKIQLVVALVLVPATMLVIAAALFTQLAASGLGSV